MKRDEVCRISKRGRIDSDVTAEILNHEGDGSSKIVENQSSKVKLVDDVVYKFYFKGLVSKEVAAAQGGKTKAMAGFGVAICDEKDELLFELKEPVTEAGIDQKGVENKALIRGLSESLALGIRNILIYCDDYHMYLHLTGRSNHKEKGVIQQLMGEIRGLREKFDSSEATLVARSDIKFVFKLAREAIVSQTSGVVDVNATHGEQVCVICLEKTDAEHMFCIEKCLHRFCFSCVKQFVEVKLLSGNMPKCLDYRCNIELNLESCTKVLTRKLTGLWKYKIKDDSIPAIERIYCPYQNCSTLMSKADLSDAGETNVRVCVKCSGHICIDCKVPSHPDLSCAEYKKLHPELLADDAKLEFLAKDKKWGQCIKCRHMIELSEGCNHMTCRCGYEFCYKCGVEWKKGQHACPDEEYDNPWDYGCGCDCGFGVPENPSGVNTHLYNFYFKGLVSEVDSTLSGFGFAICGKKDDPLVQMKAAIHDSNITVLEAELMALKRGLSEAIGLGINHVSIYCDNYHIYQLVMGRSVAEEGSIAVLMNDVQRIREQFTSSSPILVGENSIKYVYKLARETIVSDIRINVDPPRQVKATQKATCAICLDDDVNDDQMFCVEKCRHQFCYDCMKQHIEVRLLEGSVMRCPHYRCKSKLSFGKCTNLLTPKVRAMWEQRIRDDLIPVTARIYCPNPRCSALMSKTELSNSTKEAGVRKCCYKCNQAFCINCQVTWHTNLSCSDYKRFHPNPMGNDGKLKLLANQRLWRQCGKCQHLIELSKGSVRVNCRCGNKFCYRCGAAAGDCNHGHSRLPPSPRTLERPPPPPPPCDCCLICLCPLLSFCFHCY